MPNVLSEEEGDGLTYISKLGLYVSRRWAHMSGSWAGEMGSYVSRRWAHMFRGDGLILGAMFRGDGLILGADIFRGDGLILGADMFRGDGLTVLSLQLFNHTRHCCPH